MYMNKIEEILDELALVDGGKENMFSSIAWSQAVGVFNNIARLRSDDQLTDEEAIKQVEMQLAERKNILGWAAVQANRDYLPSWDDITSRLSVPQSVEVDEVAQFAELMSITKTEARKQLQQDAQRNADNASKIILDDGKEIKATIERCLSGVEHEADFEISRMAAIAIANKIADKMFDRSERSLERAAQFRRNRRISRSIATEREIYKDVMEKAESLVNELEQERDTEAPEPFGQEGSKMH